MSALSGSLKVISFPSLVRFLAGLQKSGTLHVAQGPWTGDVWFDRGQIVAAALGAEHGLPALDAIALALADGQFTFIDGAPPDERTVELPADELRSHLDQLAAEKAKLAKSLLSLDTVPMVIDVADQAAGAGEAGEVALDRRLLRTLSAVDGQRTVAEIASGRGVLQTIRDLEALLEAGVIQVDAGQPDTGQVRAPASETDQVPSPAGAGATVLAAPPPAAPATASITPPAAAAVASPAAALDTAPAQAPAAAPYVSPPVVPSTPLPAAPAAPAAPAPGTPVGLPTSAPAPAVPPVAPEAPPAAPAAVSPLAPRVAPAAAPTATPPATPAAGSKVVDHPTVVEGAGSAGTLADRPAARPQPSAAAMDRPPERRPPTLLPASPVQTPPSLVQAPQEAVAPPVPPVAPVAARQPAGVAATGATVPLIQPAASASPTVVRQPPPAAAAAPEAAAPERAAATPAALLTAAAPLTPAAPPPGRRLPVSLPILAAGVATLAVLVVGVVLGVTGRLPFGGAPSRTAPTAVPALSTVGGVATRAPATAAASVVATSPATTAATAATTASTTAPGAATTLRTVLDERFGTNQRNWPNNPQATAWLAADGTYHLLARQPGQFVAVGAPGVSALRDVAVTATFRKVGGPAGGGYGVLVRDQGPGPRDGLSQAGRYYVFEVGDRGEVGIWRRENDRWDELVPWTRSDAVRPGGETNQLEVLAMGQQLTFRVNGAQVASRTDAALAEGTVGLFAGGDGNEAVVERFTVSAAS